MTFIYELHPYSLQISTSYIKAFNSYHLTDRQTDMSEIMCHATSRVVNKLFCTPLIPLAARVN